VAEKKDLEKPELTREEYDELRAMAKTLAFVQKENAQLKAQLSLAGTGMNAQQMKQAALEREEMNDDRPHRFLEALSTNALFRRNFYAIPATVIAQELETVVPGETPEEHFHSLVLAIPAGTIVEFTQAQAERQLARNNTKKPGKRQLWMDRGREVSVGLMNATPTMKDAEYHEKKESGELSGAMPENESGPMHSSAGAGYVQNVDEDVDAYAKATGMSTS